MELDRPKVFHAEQIDGLPPLDVKAPGWVWDRHERAESVLKASGGPEKPPEESDDNARSRTRRWLATR